MIPDRHTKSFSTLAIRSPTNVPLNVYTGSAAALSHVTTKVPASAASVRPYVTIRLSSATKRSATRITHTAPSRKISGYAGQRGWMNSIYLFSLLDRDFGFRDVRHQLVHGGVQHVSERLGIQPHPQHGGGEQPQHEEFTEVDVAQMRDALVQDRPEYDSLIHPQRIRRAENE